MSVDNFWSLGQILNEERIARSLVPKELQILDQINEIYYATHCQTIPFVSCT